MPAPTLDADQAEAAMTRLKKLVYLNRIRLKDFLVDFDRLRKGTMLPANFLRGLALAGVDKVLTAAELQAVATHYTVGTSLHYTRFLADVDIIFTKPNLERRPLEEVPVEPAELLDRDRYKRSNRDLGIDKEARLAEVTAHIADVCAKRGIMIKTFFDDAARDDHSAKVHGHVTAPQFRASLKTKVAIEVPAEDVALLVEKYRSSDYPELVNYIAFSCAVDPPVDPSCT